MAIMAAQRLPHDHAGDGLLLVAPRRIERPECRGERLAPLGPLGQALAPSVEAVGRRETLAALARRPPLRAPLLARLERRAQLSLDRRPQLQLRIVELQRFLDHGEPAVVQPGP